MIVTKHAIITEQGILSCRDNTFELEQLYMQTYSLERLAKSLLSKGFTHAWILPETGIDDTESSLDSISPEWEFFSPSWRDKKLQGISAKLQMGQQKGRQHITITFPHNALWGIDGRWASKANARQLLTTILYLEKQLGIAVGGSPATTGWKLLSLIHPEWIKCAPELNLRECHFTPNAGQDFIFKSQDVNLIQPGACIHKFDRGMSYPYAATTTKYGIGTPENRQGNCYDDKAIGVWRVKIAGENPYPALLEIKLKNREWLSGPIIRLLKYLKYDVQVLEGWVFPEVHEILGKWANDLWDARKSFKKGSWKNAVSAAFAEEAIKQIAVATIGFTAYRGFEESAAEKRRPDIRLQTVSRNFEIVYHNALKIYKETGIVPFLGYMDALYYILPESDGRKALPQIVAREGEFGGYKYEGSIQIDDGISSILASRLNAGQTLEKLNEKGWVING